MLWKYENQLGYRNWESLFKQMLQTRTWHQNSDHLNAGERGLISNIKMRKPLIQLNNTCTVSISNQLNIIVPWIY